MHIGKNIEKIRELLGIKQESLALKLKTSKQTISKIEQSVNLRENMVERIANALGVSPEMIFKYSDQLLINFLKEAVSKPEISEKHPPVHVTLLEKIIELYERLLAAEQEKLRLISLKTITKNQE